MDQNIEQNVFLYSRKRIELTGITDVCEFTENTVEMTLTDGYVGIDGEELKIDYFSSDTGKVSIHGLISAVTYYGKAPHSKKSKKR